jgi:hypothetical protein
MHGSAGFAGFANGASSASSALAAARQQWVVVWRMLECQRLAP